MPMGLQTWDSNGNLMLDATYRIGRILTSFDSGTTNSSRVIPGLGSSGTPFHFVTVDMDYFTEIYVFPTITFSGDTCSWIFYDYDLPVYPYGKAPRKNVKIDVGVF